MLQYDGCGIPTGNYSHGSVVLCQCRQYGLRVRCVGRRSSVYWREHCAALEILAVDDTDFTEGHTGLRRSHGFCRGRCRSVAVSCREPVRHGHRHARLGRLLVNRLAGFDLGARVVAVVNCPLLAQGFRARKFRWCFPHSRVAAGSRGHRHGSELCRPGGFSAMTTLDWPARFTPHPPVLAQGPSPLAYAVESADSGRLA